MTSGAAPDRSLQRARFAAVLAVACALLIAVTLLSRWQLAGTRTFDPDEFQHLHAGWSVRMGEVPYRDFFEHHMPGMHFLLAGVMAPFDPAARAEDAARVVLLSRRLMWVLATVCLLVTWLTARRHGGTAVAWIAAAWLSTGLVFTARTIEIRPDVPALVAWLATLWWLVRATADPISPRIGPWLAAGLSVGGALVFNQKLLLAGPGLAAALAWWLASADRGARAARRRQVAAFCVGSAIPVVLLAAAFWWRDALGSFVTGAVTNNLGWPRELSVRSALLWLLTRDPLFCGVLVAGFVMAAAEARAWRTARSSTVALLGPGVSLVVGFFVIPAPYPQYLLLVLPIGALLGADAVWRLLAAAGVAGRPPADGPVGGPAALVSGLAAAAVALAYARPFFVHVAIYPLVGVLAGVAIVVLRRRHLPALAAAVLVLAGSVYSLQQIRWMTGLSNAAQLREMAYVHDVTTPGDRVLDGFTGLAWFRPAADYFAFLHGGVRPRLGAVDRARIVATLERCSTRPKIVFLDADLAGLAPGLAPAVARFYGEATYSGLWIRRDAPGDCPAGPPR